MTNPQDAVIEFIRNDIGYTGPLDASMDLLEAQILDSFNVVQLAMFLQQRFRIELEGEDLVRSNLSTLAAIAALVDRRQTARP